MLEHTRPVPTYRACRPPVRGANQTTVGEGERPFLWYIEGLCRRHCSSIVTVRRCDGERQQKSESARGSTGGCGGCGGRGGRG